MTAVAVIGGGAAGLGAARELLKAGVEVTLIEAGPRLGGNCVGLPVRGSDGREHAIDVGVSDFNRVTFTEVARLIDELGLETRPIRGDAHFASPGGETLWACRDGEWSFPRDVDDRDALLSEIDAFRTRALEVLEDPRFRRCSLGRYLDHIGASRTFREAYLYPRAAGSFPMPDRAPEHFHARSLMRFWNLHGIVSDVPGDRRLVVGGMHRYVAAFERWFLGSGGDLRCRTHVRRIYRGRTGVSIETVDGDGHRSIGRFDQVVFAAHASQVLPLLSDTTRAEQEALCSFAVQHAQVVVHTDPSLMGDRRDLWGAYNYLVPDGASPSTAPTITFHPNRLASLPDEVPDVFVSMNPHRDPDPDSVLASRRFVHPIGCLANERATARLEAIQGQRRTWFAGSYLRSPFVHESALTSGINVARRALAPSRVTLLAG